MYKVTTLYVYVCVHSHHVLLQQHSKHQWVVSVPWALHPLLLGSESNTIKKNMFNVCIHVYRYIFLRMYMCMYMCIYM